MARTKKKTRLQPEWEMTRYEPGSLFLIVNIFPKFVTLKKKQVAPNLATTEMDENKTIKQFSLVIVVAASVLDVKDRL